MEYVFSAIEKKWQQYWQQQQTYKVTNQSTKPKMYVLDMFPYPSGAGLHVGHPLGYIASDIYSRFKTLQGYNVLHPMGYDAFGLPAEQYAIEHGIHPAISTENNIQNFRKQLDNIGFCYDWSREIKTCEPTYYKWTQWIFLQLFHSYFNRTTQKAAPISALETAFKQEGNANHPCPGNPSITFTAEEWNNLSHEQQQQILMEYRLAFSAVGEVNWCQALGTVLANDEVVNGVSERGGHPVEKKKLRQWYLRITEYAERLQSDLAKLQWSDAMKEMQTNWIGKSTGAEITFSVQNHPQTITVYTTRPDTLFGVDFLVVAPELPYINSIASTEQATDVQAYIQYVKSRSERERMAEKKISGCFTGAYAIHPITGQQIPIWISEYVLAGYGTGAIMAVPCGDERDYKFAQYFQIPITNILGDLYDGTEANPTKDAILHNSDFVTGLPMKEATNKILQVLEEKNIGKRKTNYRMRDAAFSRQRYWGEPFPIEWKDGVAYALPETELPFLLPAMDDIKVGTAGEGPLSNNTTWVQDTTIAGAKRETSTMPGFAGSSWYFLRYMDPNNEQAFVSKEASNYWNQVDVYVGGTEHAVGHLLYSRMWTKVLYDLGHINFDEPFKKLVNQGMIQGSSRFVYRINGTQTFVSSGLINKTLQTYNDSLLDAIRVDVNFVDGFTLNLDAFKQWRNGEYAHAEFILENNEYICGAEVEKMSKSKFNTVNPDALVAKYGADTFRMYEMFLGPIEQSKPWDTKGIEGVHRFIKKLWRLYTDEVKGVLVTNDAATPAELKTLHKTIKKITEDTESFSFNTAVSAFMVCVNELQDAQCHKREILEPLAILLAPYSPHLAEELWQILGKQESITKAELPSFNAAYLVESTKEYPVSINGKLRTTLVLDVNLTAADVEPIVLQNEIVQKWVDGQNIKKIVFVQGKMINVVV
ncbi:MAG: leucine--tRNA ligase [Bacteroidetes bacterium]|nr:MAG: leucine--tRNA ligase [Bacteroidota bacterium]